MSDELALATGYFYLNSCYYYMLCVKKYKIDFRPQNTLNLKLRRRRRCWMRNIYRKRNKKSMENIFQEILAEPSGGFHNFCGMSFEDFEILLQKLGPFISKKDTAWREAIPAKIRLALTLRFLTSGDSYKSLHCLFKISHQVISKIVMEVCTSMCQVLKGEVKLPATEDDWLTVENGFYQHFPHAVGGIDGKRVVLRAPIDSGSGKYKKAYSIVLLALVDSNYCFMFADVGCQGSMSDGCVLKNSILWNKMSNNQLRLPAPTTLQNGCIDLPYVFLGDDAFTLQTNLMKPYPEVHQEGSKEQNFNKKLSSARAIVENVFGIMSVVFKVLSKPLYLQPETAKQVVMSCIILHNFLRKSKHSASKYNPPGTFDIYGGDDLLVPGSWRYYIPENPALQTFRNAHRSISPRNTEEIRNAFANYLVNK